ncbi:MAG: type VI secretion system contractile sheath large subunit [Candidatus Thiodiazotropha sp. (ex Ctena orbiculata)]|nr:type VI secretion system contractile sheath large subunit [Candidatus Thiodiazotropha taylori]MBT2996662.1 type VI secretion system contractile sheath large subunit [Candidatus Thiodiazotropha taylori]MBT3000702.1 type VI secretion system contractile sheath large subunit [Candidatus Thiodiazotropha taylori]MBV2107031.1 type VI secretion system contractile sheath large subunit [Candidatus Thiodiazotropha taylori]MBV2111030.1 type VI secretion system contractile sheath large subunit [Candidatu
MSERMHFSFKLGKQGDWNRPREPVKGFTVVMLGAFGGGTGTGNPLIEGVTTLHPVDIDTLDDIIARLRPSLTIPRDGESKPLVLRFSRLDDFHPDGLLEQLGDDRRATSETAADDLSKAARENEVAAESGLSDASESEQATLSRLLGDRPLSVEQQQEARSSITGPKKAMIEDVVRRIAETATVLNEPASMERDSAEDGQSDDKASALRSLLHLEAFQQLEASWRSVDWLLHATEPDPAIRFFILNITRSELQQQQTDHPEAKSSPLHHLLRERIDGEDVSESDLILIDNHHYGPDQANIGMLDWLGSLVDQYDGTLLAGADPGFLTDVAGTDDRYKEWQSFRTKPTAARITLLYPDVLLRLPYGATTDPVQSFSFEELIEPWTLDQLLWGNPAYAQLILLLNQWTYQGEREQPSLLTDLPAYSYQNEGERHLQPCTKHLLQEQQIELLLKLGLVPLVGSRNRNAIQIPWYQHLALPVGE